MVAQTALKHWTRIFSFRATLPHYASKNYAKLTKIFTPTNFLRRKGSDDDRGRCDLDLSGLAACASRPFGFPHRQSI
ncbi:hypothetical protein MPC4_190075 [Methylocella tundrae]|uniref:Uncharacterized protein n=1 Tax=Methylocella tundrae TaxID=227605 RepID=A0A8B6M6Q2_METTU|nr:hypothetical protein MPC1_1910004 [Methylocella tundrae]VTZ49762.1 hypothetical protein MPC4_190075 [Methylocella tundrae]